MSSPRARPPRATATIFDVQRFSIHDGPGIRTVVFLKGCSLKCRWCQNPEGISPTVQLAYYEDRCVLGCSACIPACPEGALGPQRQDRVDWSKCTNCGLCVDPCPAEALRVVGRTVGVEELLAEVSRDRVFYGTSGGGVTLSGGEPVLQAEFLAEFLPRAKAAGLHLALETAGNYPLSLLEPLLPHLDLVLFDVKLANGDAHRDATGSDNRRIKENLAALVARRTPLQVRMPIIPGTNDGARQLQEVAALLAEVGAKGLRLLRYNPLWEAKLPRLSTSAAPLGVSAQEDEYYEELASDLAELGVEATV